MTAIPSQIGPYAIESEIGRGGMGVVYLATDSRLDRKVAIKALPEHFADDPERLARFEREAKTLASLNHPNVAAIYGVEEDNGSRYLVMEYVDGETLADRLDRGPLPVDEAIEVCTQVAAGLEAAHETGVIHRDLKPANIKITPDGKAKVLDFGLARTEETSSSGSSVSQMPTLTTPHSPTTPGAILGTAPYMSPEQARGRKVDKRTDIWSFGVVLYECLTGMSPFVGETATDSIGAILHKDVDFSILPSATPQNVRHVIARCIVRDKSQRLRDIGDARLDLIAPSGPEPTAANAQTIWSPARVALLIVIAFALGGGLTAGVLSRQPATDIGAPVPVERHVIPLVSESGSALTSPVVSPDGRSIAYVLNGRLWIRRLDSFTSTPVDQGENAIYSMWSPDSAQLAFTKGAEIWRVDNDGRRPQLIGAAPDPPSDVGSGAWLEDGRIVFTTGNAGVFEIPVGGGAPREMLGPPSGASDIHEVSPLPDDRGFLVTLHADIGPFRIAVYHDGELQILNSLNVDANNVSDGVYAQSGHIVYQHSGPNGGIWAAPFSLDSLTVTGPPFKLDSEGSAPSVDAFGSLVYARNSGGRQLEWTDPETGESQPFHPDSDEMLVDPFISADGSTVLYARTDVPGRDIWLEDLVTKSRVRLTFSDEENWYPRLSPDGSRVANTEATRDPPGWRLCFYATDGSGQVGESCEVHDIFSFDRDWTVAVFDRKSETTDIDIWAWDMKPDAEPYPVITERGGQKQPALSPDGDWLAFVDSAGGGDRIFLTRFPDTTARRQITEEFGIYPRWSADGDSIVYIGEGNAIKEVDVRTTERDLQIGRPRQLIGGYLMGVSSWSGFAINPTDGRMLVSRTRQDAAAAQSIAIVKNWASEFVSTRD